MKTSLPKKFKSFRDKNGSHRRSKSSEPVHRVGDIGPEINPRLAADLAQVRPLSAEAFLSIFRNDAQKQAAKEEAEKEKEAAKVRDAGVAMQTCALC